MINWNFIFSDKIEGMTCVGYVPLVGKEISKDSGVTIGAGYDLGRRGLVDLIGLPAGLRSKVVKYIGLKGEEAEKYLHQYPLNLSKSEVLLLMSPVQRQMECALKMHFDNSRPASLWEELADGPQTVLMSKEWQYGRIWADKLCGDLWKLSLAGKWEELARYVVDSFPDGRFVARRKEETKFLLENLNVFNGKSGK